MASFEKKMKPFLEAANKMTDAEAVKLGKKDPDVEVKYGALVETCVCFCFDQYCRTGIFRTRYIFAFFRDLDKNRENKTARK